MRASSDIQFDDDGDIIEHGGIHKGDTVKLTMEIDPKLLRGGDRFVPSAWYVEDKAGGAAPRIVHCGPIRRL
ncbi:MAG: hypothetical protein ACLVEF_06775 [Bifidobacterium bifidum]